ncbi:lactonase family protein [Oceanobacillus piezotolerans]|uniref:Lactonase family protein n=1 Tax=Oceanobacillus piezotolerans TaxID=2448030 RepID=A0A498DDA9_9BACI|nr:lactonase family protein [Oceanobacillus piezotolerans]RLL46947.1 lactonase family protein [Oceanobacillus piezotolerans]
MNYKGYIGTYTKKTSKGIYSFTLDTENKKITDVKLAAEIAGPTYLKITEDKKYLYSIIKEGEQGGVAGFSIEKDGSLSAINKQLVPGPNPCHINTDKNHRLLFSTNYHKGTVDSYQIKEDGSVSRAVSTIQHEGSGPDHRQEKSHVHYAGMTPDEKYLVVVDLGSDRVLSYSVSESGELEEASRLSTPPGSGPRHLVFHPQRETIAYLVTELSSEVLVLQYDSNNGSFDIIQSAKTIPNDFTENNQGSAIHVSSDGRFVYTGNRGHNSIAIFAADEKTGKLQFVEYTHTEGDWPRDFVLDPSESFLIVANQESNNLVLFQRNKETGILSLIQNDMEAPEPICLKFV